MKEARMKLAMIGLGRMGGNMAHRLIQQGFEVVAYDRDPAAVAEAVTKGATGAYDLADIPDMLPSPAIYWLMLPAGEITEKVMREVGGLAREGDIIVDGGNSFWKHDLERSKWLKERGLTFIDVGVSGGVWGLERGYCMMIGGDDAAVKHIDPILRALAPGPGTISRTHRPKTEGEWQAEMGYVHCGPAGAGHFVKMVHNGIEYGMMQAYAEGFDILKQRAKEDLPEEMRFELNLSDISEVWRRGSVISSWLLDLIAIALAGDQSLSKFSGKVADSGEGRWTIDAAIEEAVPVDVLAAALFARFRSRVEFSFADQLLSAMRFGFGGHVEVPQ
jgi:6-phosphogluconate dehydrogenase